MLFAGDPKKLFILTDTLAIIVIERKSRGFLIFFLQENREAGFIAARRIWRPTETASIAAFSTDAAPRPRRILQECVIGLYAALSRRTIPNRIGLRDYLTSFSIDVQPAQIVVKYDDVLIAESFKNQTCNPI
jgi:hypothetical protein